MHITVKKINKGRLKTKQQKCRPDRERSVEKGQTGQSWQEGDSNANKHILQQWYAEEHLWTHNVSNL